MGLCVYEVSPDETSEVLPRHPDALIQFRDFVVVVLSHCGRGFGFFLALFPVVVRGRRPALFLFLSLPPTRTHRGCHITASMAIDIHEINRSRGKRVYSYPTFRTFKPLCRLCIHIRTRTRLSRFILQPQIISRLRSLIALHNSNLFLCIPDIRSRYVDIYEAN